MDFPAFFILLKIRLNQLVRMVKTVGLGLLLIILPLAFVFLLSILQFSEKATDWQISAVLLLLIFFLHGYRSDSKFLKMSWTRGSLFWLFFFEYLVAGLPIYAIFAGALGLWSLPLFYVPGILIIAALKAGFLSKTERQKNSFHWKWFPLTAIEWRAGMRQTGWVFWFVWLAGLALSYFTAAPLLSIFLCGAISTGFFENLEPKEWIFPIKNSDAFLFRKARLHLGIFHLLVLPHYLVYLILHVELWYFLPAVGLAASLLLVFTLFYKYGNWLPGREKANTGTVTGVLMLFLLVPFLMPVAILAVIWAFKKGTNRLRLFEQI